MSYAVNSYNALKGLSIGMRWIFPKPACWPNLCNFGSGRPCSATQRITRRLGCKPPSRRRPLLLPAYRTEPPGQRIAKILRQQASNAGIGHVTARQLRHTFETQAINRGMSLDAIAALLGHKTLAMTMV
jgi:integrase-like protein